VQTRAQPPGAKASDPEGRKETPSNQPLLEASPGPLNSLQGGSGESGIAQDAPWSSPANLARDVVDVDAESRGDAPVVGAELKTLLRLIGATCLATGGKMPARSSQIILTEGVASIYT
jgi:hypothetical protein